MLESDVSTAVCMEVKFWLITKTLATLNQRTRNFFLT
jgi:hypothetical protein